MADRTVIVRLVGMVGQYRAAMAQAAAATRALDSQVMATNRNMLAANRGMAASHGKAVSQFGQSMRSMRGMVVGFGVPLAIGMIAKSFLDFEKQMAHVSAVSDTAGKTADGMRMMRSAALDMGAAYGFSAVEVGKAQESLLKAGRTSSQILGGELSAALNLAAAGTISLDESASIMSITMTQFAKEVETGGLTATGVANTLSMAANATVSDVSGMATSLAYVGPQAAALGLSLDETVTTLSLFNQAGLEADMAGTNMRGMLTGLMSPSKMAKTAMDDLGLSLWDAEGAFVGMYEMAGQLNRLLGPDSGKSQEQIQSIVGKLSTNAQLPGMITLITQGEEGMREMNRRIHLQATAAQVASEKLNSLTGDIGKFGSAITSAGIKTLTGLSPMLREVTQGLTGLTTWFGNAGGAAQAMMLGLAGFMMFGRQRLPQGIQRVQGSAMNRGLALAGQNAAIQARMTAATALAAARATPIQGRLPGQMMHVQSLRNEARAAQDAANQYRGLSGAYGRYQADWRNATGGVQKSTVALRGMGTAMAGAGRGLMGALGGPAGLAIMGTLIGVTYYLSQVEARKKAITGLADGVVTLGGAARQTGGTLNEDMRKMFDTGPLAEMFRGEKGNLDNRPGIRDLGFNEEDITAAAAGDAKIQNRIRSVYQREIRAAGEDFYGSFGFRSAGKSAHLKEQLAGLDEGWKRQLEIQELTDREDARNAEMGRRRFGITLDTLTDSDKAMISNVQAMEAPDAKIENVLKAMVSNIDMITGAYLSASNAQSAFFGSAAGAKESFEGVNKAGETFREKPRIRFTTGQFEPRDARGRKQHDQASKTVESAFDVGKAAAARGLADLPDSYREINAAAMIAAMGVAEARKEFVKQYAPLVGGAAAAERLATNYGLVTDRFTQSIGAEGVNRAVEGFSKLNIAMEQTGDGKVVVSADTEPALRKVVGLKAVIQKDELTGQVSYVFPSAAEMAAAVAKAEAQIPDLKPKHVPVPSVFKGMSANAVEHSMTINPKLGSMPGIPPMIAAIKPQMAPVPPIPPMIAAIRPQMGPVPQVPDQSMGVRPHLTGGVPQIPDQFVNVHVRSISSQTGVGRPGGIRWGGVHSFAQGGIHAKVGKGDLIRWAEPETGGEAYIPRLGDAARSKAILGEAAAWYGMGLHKMAVGGVHSFATGSITDQPTVPLSEYLSRYMSEPDTHASRSTDATIAQRDAALDLARAQFDLRQVQKDSKHTALDLADAQNRLADARRDLATSNVQLAKSRMSPRDQFKASLDMGVRNTGAFIANLNALSAKGYGALAMQLLQMGGPEAEAIAAGARGWSASVGARMNKQAEAAQGQQKTLENMPAMLAIRGALKKGTTYDQLVGSGMLTDGELNAALELMKAELKKSKQGRAMLDAMAGGQRRSLAATMRGYPTGIDISGGRLAPQVLNQPVVPAFSKPAGAGQIQITVKGEGVISNMIEATVDGRLVTVTKAVTHGSLVG